MPLPHAPLNGLLGLAMAASPGGKLIPDLGSNLTLLTTNLISVVIGSLILYFYSQKRRAALK